MTGIFCSQFKQISQYVINKNNGHTEYLKWTIVSITTVDTVIDLDWYFYMKNKFRFIQVYKTKLALLFYVFTVSFKEKMLLMSIRCSRNDSNQQKIIHGNVQQPHSNYM